MAAKNSEADEEDILNYIYLACDKLDSGLIATSCLIKYIETSSNRANDEALHQQLMEHFDKEGVDPSINFEEFHDLMTSFISSVRYDGCLIEHEIEDPSISPTFSSECSTGSSAFVNDRLEDENEDISEQLEHYKSFSSKLTSEKVDMLNRLNLADDQLVQFQVENKVLREAAKSHESTKDLLQQTTADAEELRLQLNHYQEQQSECEEMKVRLEHDNQKMKAEVSEARNEIDSILKEKDELIDANLDLTLEVLELTEGKLINERNLDLYKNLYIERSKDYDLEVKKYEDMADHAKTLEEKNTELDGKLRESEDKLKHEELCSCISPSSFESIDNEGIPLKLASRCHKFRHLKNEPSLCQELQSSFICTPTCSMGELELCKALASSSVLNCLDESLGMMAFCDDDDDDEINILSDDNINQENTSADVSSSGLKSEFAQLSKYLHHEISNLNEKMKLVEDKLSSIFDELRGRRPRFEEKLSPEYKLTNEIVDEKAILMESLGSETDGTETNDSSVVNLDKHLAKNRHETSSTNGNHCKEDSRTAFQRAMSAGDSKDITLLAFNRHQHHRITQIEKCEQKEMLNIQKCLTPSRRSYLRESSTIIWAALIVFIAATFFILDNRFSFNLVDDIVPHLALNYKSHPIV